MRESALKGQSGPVGRNAEQARDVRWALVSLSLSMLLSSLGTSIANVGLPRLAEAFAASFQEVQWIVLVYLLTVTALIRSWWPSSSNTTSPVAASQT